MAGENKESSAQRNNVVKIPVRQERKRKKDYNSEMKQLLLIDANSIIHRSFHALPPFTGPDGRPTGALYGISAMMLTLLRTAKPDYAAALFDRPEPTFRDKKYAEYKGQRPPTADELVAQIIEARKLFEA